METELHFQEASPQPRVSLVRGDDRYANVSKALELIKDDVKVERAQNIVIKPNLTSLSNHLAATHADSVRALLDFLKGRTSAAVTIAEGAGTGSQSVMVGYRDLGYADLALEYGIRLFDLNTDKGVTAEIYDSNLKPIKVRLAKTIVEADYRISICPPKTHDFVVITASLKNLLVGSLLRGGGRLRMLPEKAGHASSFATKVPLSSKLTSLLARFSGNDKLRVHQGYVAMNLNLLRLAKVIAPHLSVIDGFEGMEGAGPGDGDKVDLRIALVSTDFLAADVVASKLMGFDIDQVGYLFYCHRAGLGEGDVTKLQIVGESIASCARPFKPHPSYQEQLKWRKENYERYL